MTPEQLKDILDKHAKWLANEDGGVRFDLRSVNLRDVNLRNADLRHARLIDVDLSDSVLRGANLQYSCLIGSNLTGCILCGADLRSANLSDANLWRADLRNAILEGACLARSNLNSAILSDAIARLDFGGWSICVYPDCTTIGCQKHSNAYWLRVTPNDVADMDCKARDWWTVHGEGVKAVIRTVMAKHKAIEASKTKEGGQPCDGMAEI